MKDSTEYNYEFKNSGSPKDTERGLSNWKGIVMALAKWLPEVSMNNMIHIKITRDTLDEDDFAAMLEAICNTDSQAAEEN